MRSARVTAVVLSAVAAVVMAGVTNATTAGAAPGPGDPGGTTETAVPETADPETAVPTTADVGDDEPSPAPRPADAVVLDDVAAAELAAAQPVPDSPVFGPTVDDYADYEAENVCDPTDKPGPKSVLALLIDTYGPATGYISRSCSGGATSGHNAGRALDWMHSYYVPDERAEVEAFIGWLTATDSFGNRNAMMRRLGIMYMIWDSEIYESYDSPPTWQPYFGSSPHTDHLHISFSYDGAQERTTFWNPEDSDPSPVTPADPTCPTPSTLAPPATVDYGTGLGYVPISPTRLVDTRKAGLGVAFRCRLAASGRIDVTVAGVGGVPASGVAAVVLNLTGVAPDGSTWLSAYPAGTPWPGTSAASIAAGEIAAGLVVVPVGTNGKVSLLNGRGRTDALIDVVGYHPLSGGSAYNPIAPKRTLDTRTGSSTPFRARETRTVTVAQVPVGATGVIVNLAAVDSAGGGYVTLVAGGSSTAGVSTLNTLAGRTVSNRAYVRLGTDRTLTVFSSTGTDVILDVVGWFGATGQRYVPATSRRAFDSRNAVGDFDRFTGLAVQTTNLRPAGVPTEARTVVLTLISTDVTVSTYAVLWPDGRRQPATSDLNTGPGLTTSNLAVIPMVRGAIDATIGAGSGDLLGDVMGWFR